jgi:hypothetical protein
MSFYGFWKNQIFTHNPHVLAYDFTKRSPVWGKNRLKLHISLPWPPYCGSLIHNSPVYEFLWVLKNLNFHSKSIGVTLDFIEITTLEAKTDRNSIFHGHYPHIMDRLYIMVSILLKITSLGHKLTDTSYFLVGTHILWISYT